MLHLSTVESTTLELLKKLQQLPVLCNTRLVGGTALALQLRGAHDPAALSCFAACGFSLCRNPLAGILFLLLPFLHRSRTSAQRLVLSPLVGTRSAGRRKRHKPPTRARRAVTGVLSVRSTCVFNKIGIFPLCHVLIQLLHLPVVVLLERELNWSDCE